MTLKDSVCAECGRPMPMYRFVINSKKDQAIDALPRKPNRCAPCRRFAALKSATTNPAVRFWGKG